MPAIPIGVSDVLVIITHIKKWVTNLLRAKEERKRESREALEAVILAVRETKIYLRDLRERGKKAKSIKTEKDLALIWTKLSFKVRSIKLEKLADSCNTLGKYWADPADFSKELLNSDVIYDRLSDIENIANNSLKQLTKAKKKPKKSKKGK